MAIDLTTKLIDKNNKEVGLKRLKAFQKNESLRNWIKNYPKNKEIVIPLKNAVTPATAKIRSTPCWSDEAIGFLFCNANDIYSGDRATSIVSSSFSNNRGFFIKEDNLEKVLILFAVRRLPSVKWHNTSDQFYIPNKELSLEFINDCIIFSLFNRQNLSASANNLLYDGKEYSIVNHFIPFTEKEVNAPTEYESHFLINWLKKRNIPNVLSKEALNVYNEGLNIWKSYYKNEFSEEIKEKLKLNKVDVGWYQIRKALEFSNCYDFTNFKIAYINLTNKLRPFLYEYGFLKSEM